MIWIAAGCATRSASNRLQEDLPSRPPTPNASASSAVAWERLEFNQPQMGVPFRIVLYSTNPPSAEQAAQAAFDRIAQLNRVLSDYDPESEINRLCHETPVGTPAPVSPDLWRVLAESQRLAARTDGAFDVTVGPYVQLWRRARRHRELPPTRLLDQARPRVGWQHLKLDPVRRTVRLLVPGMRLDFGGIAKGFAADEALKVLEHHGFSRALVAAAGDVTAGDPPPGQSGWRVEIGLADVTNAPPGRIVWLRRAAVATSGDVFQRLEIDGRRYSHIVDPRTGVGLTDHSLVTILAKDGMTADSLATAVSVLGPKNGLRLVEKTPGSAALILRAPQGRLVESRSRRLRDWLQPNPPG